jgi:prepilin-type N-terminal cleavage/methylation domain-containing protein
MKMADGRWPTADCARVGARRCAFTLIEMLVVIAIIGALAALIVGGAGIYREKSVRSRVETELRQVIGAIELYHKQYGFYPPDNPNSPTNSALYHELTGNVPDGTVVSAQFRVRGIVNNGLPERPGGPPTPGTNFLSNLGAASRFGPSRFVSIGPDTYVLTVPVKGPDGDFNPWRYVSKNPTNNTETYDLWAEVLVGNKRIVISNWKE